MHPTLIDAALQLCLVAIGGEAGQVLPHSLYLPLGADRILINAGPHQSLMARARIRKAADEAVLVADIWVDAPSGEWAMIVEGMRFGRAEPLLRAQAHAGESLYRVDWAPLPIFRRRAPTSAERGSYSPTMAAPRSASRKD